MSVGPWHGGLGGRVARVGLVGTGPMAASFARMLSKHCPDLALSGVLTRRPLGSVTGFAPALLTDSADALIDGADIVVEMTGDVLHGTDVCARALGAGRPVATLNAELHVTTGSYLATLGAFSEAEGDQPGSLAALAEDARAMGFSPLVYGNMKGFLDLNPSPENMAYWAVRQGISVPNATGATDGSKVQIEQGLVGNGLGADIACAGLAGPAAKSLAAGAARLAELARAHGGVLSDYVLADGWAPTGVFVVARHDEDQAALLEYFKLGPGPDYLLVKPYHLCSLEVAKTVRRLLAGGPVLLNNGITPRLGMAAVAKRDLPAGTYLDRGAGSFEVRGVAIELATHPRHVPLGLLAGARLTRAVEAGEMLMRGGVELADHPAVAIGLTQAAGGLSPCAAGEQS